MANLKAGTLIGGNMIWNHGNLPVNLSNNTLYLKTYKVYTEADKPTPADVGAVNKAGDTMTGNLNLSGTAKLNFTNLNTGVYIHAGKGDGASQDVTNLQIRTWQGLGISPTAGNDALVPDAKNSIWMNARNGTIQTIGDLYADTNKRVYHQGFKPTFGDVGAAPDGYGLGVTQCARVPNKQLNDAINAGFYAIYGEDAGGPVNSGLGPSGSRMLVVSWSSAHVTQMFWPINSTDVYVRYKGTNAGDTNWSDWQRIYTTRNPPSATEVKALPISGGTMTGAITLGSQVIKGQYDKTLIRDHGNGNVTISASVNSSNVAGDLYLGYNSGSTNLTRNIRIESPMSWKGSTTIVNDGGINSEFLQGPIRTEKDAANIWHTIIGGTDTVNRGRTIVAAGECGKQIADNTTTGDEVLHLAADATAGIWLHTGVQAGWGTAGHKKVKIHDGEIYAVDGTNKVYHVGNKPTLTELGAVAKAGDTMTGKLRINRSGISGWPNATASDAGNYINAAISTHVVNNNGIHVFGDGATNARRMGIQSGHADAQYSTSYGILDLNPYGGTVRVNGGTVYHTGYKPTPADVGALALIGGTVTGKITINSATTATNQFEAKNGNTVGIFRLSEDTAIFGTLLSDVWTGAIKVGKSDFVYTPNASTWYKVYHQGFKPTAVDVAAIPTSGNVQASTRLATRTINTSDDVAMRDYNYAGFYRTNSHAEDGIALPALMIHCPHSSGKAHGRGLGFNYAGWGVWTTSWNSSGVYQGMKKVYTEVDKPTAAEVGAIATTGGTLTGLLKTSLTGNVFETNGGFFRSNTAQVMSMDGKIYSFVTSTSDAHLCQNAYWDGAAWRKYDASKTSSYIVAKSTGVIEFKGSAATATDPNQLTTFTHNTTSGNTSIGGALNIVGNDITKSGVVVQGSRTAEDVGLIRGGVQGGSFVDWRARAAGLLVDCQNSANAAHNIFKATHWGVSHLCAMDVHRPADGNTQVAFHMGGNNNTFMFYENGQFHANDVYIRSDIRLKSNFKKIENALDKVCTLSGHTYDKKNDLHKSTITTREAGIIANELQKVLPEAVSENGEDKLLTISNSAVNALLVEAIKELKAEIEELKRGQGK